MRIKDDWALNMKEIENDSLFRDKSQKCQSIEKIEQSFHLFFLKKKINIRNVKEIYPKHFVFKSLNE
jgi:hypothetical protein